MWEGRDTIRAAIGCKGRRGNQVRPIDDARNTLHSPSAGLRAPRPPRSRTCTPASRGARRWRGTAYLLLSAGAGGGRRRARMAERWYARLSRILAASQRLATTPRSLAATAAPERHLEELHPAGREGRLRPGQIQAPRADERLAAGPASGRGSCRPRARSGRTPRRAPVEAVREASDPASWRGRG